MLTTHNTSQWYSYHLPVLTTPSPNAHSVRLVCLPDGRPNGQAYVEFANPEDAAIGYQKNKQMVGARYVEMFPATREEMEQRLGGGGQQYR